MNEVKLILENIGVFKGKREFKLSKGLNVIYAPNASGKTSLITGLKAIAVPTLTLEELRRTLNDYEDKGRVMLLINGSDYVVELSRRPGGSIEARGKRLSEDGVIKKVAFVDLENELVNAVYGGDEERVKQVLRDVTGISHLETIVNVLEGMLREYEYTYEKKRKEYESRKEEIESQIKEVEARLDAVRKRILEILRDPSIEPIREEIEQIEKDREKLENELSRLRSEEIGFENKKAFRERDHREIIAQLEVLVKEREDLTEKIKEIEEKIHEYKEEIEHRQEVVKKLESKKRGLEDELREIIRAIERRKGVRDYAMCPYCGASIDKNRLEREIQELEERRSQIRERILGLDEEISRELAYINELKQICEEKYESSRKRLNEVNEKISTLERDKRKVEEELKYYEKELTKIKVATEDIEKRRQILDKRLELLRKEKPVALLVDELRRLQSEESYLRESHDRLYGRRMQIDQMHKDVILLEDKVKTLRLLLEYFKVRLDEVQRLAIDEINATILKYFKLLKLAELEYPILAEDFALTLTRVGGTPTTLAELSDAEKAILAIVMLLALNERVASDFPLYCIDTLIEFVDDTRAKDVLKYLMEMARKADKIIVVTKIKPYTGEPAPLTQEDILMNEIPI